MKIKDKIGQRFGRLIVVSLDTQRGQSRRAYWLCVCDCGKSIVINSGSLSSGNTRSCGCLKRDSTRQRSIKHGCTRNGRNTSAYQSWLNMRSRCYNQKNKGFHNYGGRGVKVCDRWMDVRFGFLNFLSDMG